MIQTQLQLPPHTRERSPEQTAYVQAHAVRLGGNNMKLIKFWQNQNVPISCDNAKDWIGVRNLVQRVADLRALNIVILDKWDPTKTFKFYYLGCQCAEPRRDVTGCYLHSQELKVK
jgi:hypothetical protein